MDSLHPSLSQALPLRDYDAEQALQAPFRAAALGIATFYKKSAENGRKAYTLGYSSALQDVLTHLQTALDQPDSQHSQQSMALTIGRVIDYIQRRQEALRAESQEPNDEDAAHPSPAPQHRQTQSNAASSQHALSPTELQSGSPDNHPHSRESSNLSLPVESASQTTQSVRRRTSPRRMTPITFQNPSRDQHPSRDQNSSRETVSNTDPSCDSNPQPLPPPVLTTGILPQPINVTFSSFSASPLPQHQQSGSLSTGNSNRRHRGVTSDGARKGKVKERAHGTDRSAAGVPLDSTGLIPRGYSHYNSNNSSSSSNEVKTLSSLGNKRRFPVDSVLSSRDSNPSTPSPPSMRISRRSNSSKTLPPTSLEQTGSTAVPETNLGDPIQIHNSDDAVMILQGGDSDQDAGERPSKRFFFL